MKSTLSSQQSVYPGTYSKAGGGMDASDTLYNPIARDARALVTSSSQSTVRFPIDDSTIPII
jgi:hypothetical protein